MSVFPDMLVAFVNLGRFDDQVPFHWRWTGTNSAPGGNGNALDLHGYEQWALDGDSLVLRPLGRCDEMDYR